jgi:hypothetical protein
LQATWIAWLLRPLSCCYDNFNIHRFSVNVSWYLATNINVTVILWGGIVQGIPSTAIIFWYIVFPKWVLIIADLSTRALWQ